MNYDGLIERYGVQFDIVQQSGSYVRGEYVAGSSTMESATGAIVSIPRRKVYQSGGYLSAKDLRLFVYSALPDNCKIRYRNALYSVESDTDRNDFAGFYSYVLKWVSVFEEGSHE